MITGSIEPQAPSPQCSNNAEDGGWNFNFSATSEATAPSALPCLCNHDLVMAKRSSMCVGLVGGGKVEIKSSAYQRKWEKSGVRIIELKSCLCWFLTLWPSLNGLSSLSLSFLNHKLEIKKNTINLKKICQTCDKRGGRKIWKLDLREKIWGIW